jgi:protein-disulfide isomerase
MRRHTPPIIIVIVLVAAIGAGAMLLRSKQAASPIAESRPVASTSGDSGPAGNMANISVTLEEFGDYQCPPCGTLHPELKRLKEQYGARLNFVFSNLPLTKIHKNAFTAAQAAEAARLQEHFWEMHDLLYENQSAWKDENDPRPVYLRYAAEVGLDLKRFSRDMEGAEVQRRIDEDVKRAEAMGILGTPTILIEGRQLRVEATTPDGIRGAIEVMMARKAR